MLRSTSVGCIALACALGCARSSGDAPALDVEPATDVNETTAPAREPPSTVVRITPTRWLTLRESPYGATLGVTEDTSFLLTSSAAYRFVQGEAPARWTGDFGVAPALIPGHIRFWSNGAFRQVPTSGGEAKRVAAVTQQPRRFVTSGDQIAWLEQTPDREFSIHTLDGAQPRVVHSTSGYVGALAMEDDRIYFAERAADRSWRLGLVPRSGGAATHTKPKRGRLPSMLVLAESLYYYDGPSGTVLRVSPDLDTETVLARDVICSPLAVAENVYCAQPAGLVELGLDGGVRSTIPLDAHGAITAMAATPTRLIWVSDIGNDQLAVDSITLPLEERLAP